MARHGLTAQDVRTLRAAMKSDDRRYHYRVELASGTFLTASELRAGKVARIENGEIALVGCSREFDGWAIDPSAPQRVVLLTGVTDGHPD